MTEDELNEYANDRPDCDGCRLITEVRRLQAWVNDLQSGMYINCVYCGHRYGPGDEVPATMADVLKEHIEQCPQHPMSHLKSENRRLQDTIKNLHSECHAHADQHAGEERENASLRAMCEELAEALNELYDHQNGPPLLGPKHEPAWRKAMDSAKAALAKWRAMKETGDEQDVAKRGATP